MPEISQKERAALINTLWEAFIAPEWEASELKAFGKILYDGQQKKKSLKDLSEKEFNTVFPLLKKMTDHLITSMKQEEAHIEATKVEEVSKPDDSAPIKEASNG